MSDKILVNDIIGSSLESEFGEFDLTEVQNLLLNLRVQTAIDIAHAEVLAQKSLRCADILSEYLGSIVKTVSYLEGKVNSAKNKASLEYQSPDGGKVTMEMRKWAGESSKQVEELQEKLARAKGTKSLLEKKYDIVIKSHHQYKDIASGLRRSVLGYKNASLEIAVPEGYE